jgi:hypothetical protein
MTREFHQGDAMGEMDVCALNRTSEKLMAQNGIGIMQRT